MIQLEIDGAVASLTLCRPEKRNALSRELIEQLTAAIKQVAGTPDVRLLVLAAEGTVFCAGMDLQQMEDRAKAANAEVEWQRDTVCYQELLKAMFQLPIPTLAIVQGPALAGGLGLVLACDLVLAADAAVFGLPEPKRGITAAVVTPLLIYRIGNGQATCLLLSGENWSAQRACTAGLCHEVVPAAELGERQQKLKQSILTGAASSLAITKQQIRAYDGDQMLAQLKSGMEASARARETADAREGLAAFLEKRAPAWVVDVESS